MRIIIAIAEQTLSSTREIGVKYREQRDRIFQKKTHITQPPEQIANEESKINEVSNDVDMEDDQGPRDATLP